MPKHIVIVGTNHRAQAHYEGVTNEFASVLNCLLITHVETQVIFEEWDLSGLTQTVGFVIAQERNLRWENVGTPDTPDFRTGGKFQCSAVPIIICTYGPIKKQMHRECHFLDRINSIMSDRDHGLFVCGLAHIQSMGESCLPWGSRLTLTNGSRGSCRDLQLHDGVARYVAAARRRCSEPGETPQGRF